MIEPGRWVELGGAAPKPRWSSRLIALALLVIVVVGILGIKLAQIQVTQGSGLASQARANTVRRVVLEAERGIIYDRHGVPLVDNVPIWNLTVVPQELATGPSQRAAEVRLLSRATGMPEEQLLAPIQQGDPYSAIQIGPDLTQEQVLLLEERMPDLPGVGIAQRATRRYLDPLVFGQVLGYVGRIDSAEYQRLKPLGYQPDESIGKVGVEAGMESILRGSDGWADVETDARGVVVRTLSVQEPVPGNSVYLTIDAQLQRGVAQVLAAGLTKYEKKAGAAVVIDPNNGEVLAMVSLPGYDTNLFAGGISLSAYKGLTSDPNKPLINRAISGQYPPGSTFKMVTAIAGLQDGKITPQTMLNCPASISYGGWVYRNWTGYNSGYMNLATALAESCDTFFYQVADMVGDVSLARYARAFGFGQALDIEMPGAQPGLVPDRNWKLATCGSADPNTDACRWNPGDTLIFGIGQSYLLTSPLNQAVYVSALANSGSVLKPTLMHEAFDAAGRLVQSQETVVTNTVPASPDNLESVRAGMRLELSQSYFQAWFRQFGVPADGGGKTGTAQWGNGDGLDNPTHSWFLYFTPYDKPEIALCVFIEGGALSMAAPVTIQMVRFYKDNREAIRRQ